MKRSLRNRISMWCRVRASLLAPIAIAIAFATMLVSPAQALWFQVLSADVSVTTGVFPTAVLGTEVAPSTTPGPSQTPEACAEGSLADLHFAAVIPLVGDGPFDATVDLKNEGSATAHNVMIGFAPIEGAEFLLRVDFGNSQFWLIDGLPDGTLYDVGDLAPGETAHIQLAIQMTDAWIDPPIGARAIIEARVVDLRCDQTGDSTDIELNRDEPATETPSPEVTFTPEVTLTPEITLTPEPTIENTETAVATTPTISDETQIPESETATPDTTETPEVTATPAEELTGTPSPKGSPTRETTSTTEADDTRTPDAEPSVTKTALAVTKTAVLTRTATRTTTPEAEETSDPTETVEPTQTDVPASPTEGPRRTATPTRTPTAVPTATTAPTETPPQPTGTVLAAVATPPPLNQVLGDQARPRTGEVLPGTGSGLDRPRGSKGIAGLVLIAVAFGFVGIAIGVGRRLT